MPLASQLYGAFEGTTDVAVIVGSGPSLKGFDFRKLRNPNLFTIAINREPFLGNDYHPDAWIYSDYQFSYEYADEDVSDMLVFETRKTLVKVVANLLNPKRSWASEGFEFVQSNHRTTPLWTYDGDELYVFGTTAHTAINLACKLGFREIRLLGIDFSGNGEYYSERPKGNYGHNFQKMKHGMKRLLEGLPEDAHVTREV